MRRFLAATVLVLLAAPAAGAPGEEPADRSGRDATAAILASAAFPALGQLYNDEGWKTVVLFTWQSYAIGVIVSEGLEADRYRRRAAALAPGETWRGLGYGTLRARFHDHDERQRDWVWYGSAVFLASLLDAYVFAHLHDFDTEDIRGRRARVLPVVDGTTRAVGLQLRVSF
ncbi:MAG: hypothetical protein JW819_08930 [Candidatus Krumholzibacteriota bacterium]|nr:hypothetical protein [Candidatus Krumholzibacteriota bacterium]